MSDAKDVLVEAMARIESHPEDWVQSRWITTAADAVGLPEGNTCGTAGCLAGWFTMLDTDALAEQGLHVNPATSAVEDRDGFEISSIAKWASGRLEINQREAVALFESCNTLDNLRAGVKAVLNGEDVEDAVLTSRAEAARAARGIR